METEYRRDLQNSYLVIKEEEEDTGYVLQMITRNHIPGLLKCECRNMDEKRLYYYEVTSRISLEDRCKTRKIGGLEVRRIIESFAQTLEALEEYLLSPEGICLEAEYIFLDAQLSRGEFCYLPGHKKSIGESFRELMEYLLPVLDHESQKEAMQVYGFYHYSVQNVFSLNGLQKELRKYSREQEFQEKEEDNERLYLQEQKETLEIEREKQRVHEEALEAFFEDEQEESEQNPVLVTVATVGVGCYVLGIWFLWKNYPLYLGYWCGIGAFLILVGLGYQIVKRKRQVENYEEENDRNEKREEIQEETVHEVKNSLHIVEKEKGEFSEENCFTQLLNVEEKEEIWILEEQIPHQGRRFFLEEKEMLLLGSLKQEVDVWLPYQTVSRLHARLRLQGEQYVISDLNSKNGTWVNGKELVGEMEVLLYDGDELCFADSKFLLKKTRSL